MPITLTHTFTSAKADGPDTTVVQPSDWNDEHVLELAQDTLIGRVSSGAGVAEEVPCTSYARTLLAAANQAAFEAAAGGGIIPTGGIIMWSGSIAAIPTGWYLCNGSNGTPDLRDRFIIGASQDGTGVAKTNVTGSLTTSGGSKNAVNVSHTHTATVTDPGHTHNVEIQYSSVGSGGGSRQYWANTTIDPVLTATRTDAALSKATGVTVANSSEGVSGTDANLPPYYALALIMKA